MKSLTSDVAASAPGTLLHREEVLAIGENAPSHCIDLEEAKMHRNTLIVVCAIFCVVAVGAGLLVVRLSGQSAVAVQPTEPGATSAPQTIAAAPPTSAAPTIIAPAATSQPEPTSTPAATSAPATDTAVPTATSQPEPTSTPAPSAVPVAEAPAYIEYTVQKGDILYTIAKEHNVTVEEILAINQIPRPESLAVGQIIRIPRP